MKNNASKIFTDLFTNKSFRDWVVNPNEEINNFWENWIGEHPGSITEVENAHEFIERITFKKKQLLAFELDELLEKILSFEKPISM